MDLLVVLLVVLPPIDWVVALILTNVSHRHPNILTLRERAIAAIVCAIVASIAGALAWARLGLWAITGEDALTLIAVSLVLVSVPNVYWLALLLARRFRIEDER